MWMPIIVTILSVVGIALCFLSRRRSVSYTNEEMEHLASTCQFYDPVDRKCFLVQALNDLKQVGLPLQCSYTDLHDAIHCPIIHPEYTSYQWSELLDLWLLYRETHNEIQKD